MSESKDKVQFSKLHIFTIHGKTFTFFNVIMLEGNETCLNFTYSAQSDGQAKEGTFWLNNMAGFSVTR